MCLNCIGYRAWFDICKEDVSYKSCGKNLVWDSGVFSHPSLKPWLLFSTLQILTPRLRCLIFILSFIRCFPGCEISIAGLMCCPFPISLASFGVCKQGSQLLPLQQSQGSFAGPPQDIAGNFIPLLCCPCKISQSCLCTALVYKRRFLRSGDRKMGEELGVGKGSRGPSLWCARLDVEERDEGRGEA